MGRFLHLEIKTEIDIKSLFIFQNIVLYKNFDILYQSLFVKYKIWIRNMKKFVKDIIINTH